MYADFLPPCNFFANILGFIPSEDKQLLFINYISGMEKVDCTFSKLLIGSVFLFFISFAFIMTFHSAENTLQYSLTLGFGASFMALLFVPLSHGVNCLNMKLSSFLAETFTFCDCLKDGLDYMQDRI